MATPDHIGKYEILDLIGRGGMGAVYKARDTVLGRLVAIKLMTSGLDGSTDTRERFLREARAVSMLQHPNIVVVHELGEHEGNPYIVMEFLDGEPLDHTIRARTPLTVLQKIDIVVPVAKGLQYAHERGIVHRDIKPGNIVLMKDGTVKVVDFGMARLANQTITRMGAVLGTVSYMSPEQLNGEQVSARSDIFSLGVVLYLLMTGKLPFEGVSTADTITRVLLQAPPRLEQVSPIDQPELQPILDKALAKKAHERYQTCSELAEALTRFRKRYEVQAQLTALEEEKKALLVQLERDSVSPSPSAPPPQTATATTPEVVPTSPPPVSSPATSTTEPEQSTAIEPSPPAPRPETKPAAKAADNRLKWISAGLALIAAVAILYAIFGR